MEIKQAVLGLIVGLSVIVLLGLYQQQKQSGEPFAVVKLIFD